MKQEGAIEGISHDYYTVARGNSKDTHRLALEFEAKLIRAEGAALKCLEYKKNGYTPDIIISHPGWGETLLIKEVWPDVKLVILNFIIIQLIQI